MAELNVQPKKKSSFLPWLLLLAGLILLIWLFTRNRGDAATTTQGRDSISATTSVADHTTSSRDWSGIDFNAPPVAYEEISDKNINVRGGNDYGIYGLGENVLFDEGKAPIRPDAQANLKQIAVSIEKRYKSGELRIYGYTDAQGNAGANKELAQQRADAVKLWLQNNGFDGSRISVNAIGESAPVASNNTEAGRQQNRRVEIVARTAQ